MSLVSLNDYKDFSKISISNANEDAYLQTLANDVEQRVKTFLGRDLETQTYTEEKHDGDGTKELLLDQYPVTSVTKLEFYHGLNSNGSENWEEQVQNDEYERLVISKSGVSIILDGLTFPKGSRNVRVTYVAGYATIPYDIQMGCKELFKLYYNESRGEYGLGKSSVRGSDGLDVSYDVEAENKILNKLGMYRNIYG